MVNEEEQVETLHLFILREDQLPSPPNYSGLVLAVLCSLALVNILGVFLFWPRSGPTVSFSTTISGFRLPAVHATRSLVISATGKGHIKATEASGTISFYNGQTYSQIIPAGTILKSRDGVSIITEQAATIPPAVQTTPPTYGQTSVSAHVLLAGRSGNIAAGDINEACCVTSVIAQNPSPFTGGRDARDYSYLTAQDVAGVQAAHTAQLQAAAQTRFAAPLVLERRCSISSVVYPAIGTATATARLTLHVICTALSYSRALALQQIRKAVMLNGQVSAIQFSVVGVAHRQARIMLEVYVTAQVQPVLRLPMY